MWALQPMHAYVGQPCVSPACAAHMHMLPHSHRLHMGAGVAHDALGELGDALLSDSVALALAPVMHAAVDPSQDLAFQLVGNMAALRSPIPIEELRAAVSRPASLGRPLPVFPRWAARLHLSAVPVAGLVEAWGGDDAQLVLALTTAVQQSPMGCASEAGLICFWDNLIRWVCSSMHRGGHACVSLCLLTVPSLRLIPTLCCPPCRQPWQLLARHLQQPLSFARNATDRSEATLASMRPDFSAYMDDALVLKVRALRAFVCMRAAASTPLCHLPLSSTQGEEKEHARDLHIAVTELRSKSKRYAPRWRAGT